MAPIVDAPRRLTLPSAPSAARLDRDESVRRRLITAFNIAWVSIATAVAFAVGLLPALSLLVAPGVIVLASRSRRGARVLELTAAWWLLVACAPLMLVAAVWVRRHDGGPVLLREKRLRQDGSPYLLLSFRVQDLRTGAPTPPGTWLRERDLHVLPGLVNVLRSDIPLTRRLPVSGGPHGRTSGSATRTPFVVHVTEVLGGVETYLRLMVDHSHDSVVYGFVFARESPFADELRDRGHRVAIVPMPRTRTLVREVLAARDVRRALRQMNPDVVHLHSSQAGLVGRIAWARRGRFVVHTPHAYYYLGKTGAARFALLVAEILLGRLFPTRVLTTSPSETARAVHDVRIPARRVTTCTNAVAIPPSTSPRELTGAVPRVGMVGRISAQKNVSMYLRVVSRLQNDPRVTTSCHFVGLGHYDDDTASFHAMMHGAGVDEGDLEVHRWMPRDDLLTWLDSCDVLVLTSDYESFGYALAEASACGIPVVGTDIDGIRDVVLDRVSGFLVPRDDDAAMAERIVEILSDPAGYREMSSLGRAVAARRIDISTFTDRIEGYYSTGALPTTGAGRRGPRRADVPGTSSDRRPQQVVRA